MNRPHTRDIVRHHLRFLVAAWTEDRRSDEELLRRFAHLNDEDAFATLVGRHGALVWSICLRILRVPQDAEDAFQSTFLSLARDAGQIARGGSLTSWLHATARCRALDARRSIDRRRRLEEQLCEIAESHREQDATPDLKVILDEELSQLPRKYLDPLVLCQIEGKTYAETASELGCSVAAVHRRVQRAQELLRRRLTRRGVVAGSLATCLAASRSVAVPPVKVLAGALEAGVAGAAAAAGGVTAATLPLWKLALCVALVGLGIGAAGFLTRSGPAADESVPEAGRDDPPAEDEGPRQTVTGRVLDDSGVAQPFAQVTVLARRPFGPGEQGLRDEVLAAGQADAGGRFSLTVRADFPTWFPERRVTLLATAPGRAAVSRSVPLPRSASPGPVELRLGEARPLTGRLLDPEGRPAAGVVVRVVRLGDVVAEPVYGRGDGVGAGWPRPAVTDGDGRFSLPALGRVPNVWLQVTDPRYALETIPVSEATVPLVGEVVWPLSAARVLEVEVRADDTDRPLPGARLTLVTGKVPSHAHFCAADHGAESVTSLAPLETDAVADAHGCFRVALPAVDEVVLKVHPPAGELAPYLGARRTVSWVKTEGRHRLVVRLPRGVWVRGRVLEGPSDRPVAGATVHWGHDGAALPEWRDEVLLGRDALVQTDAAGEFRLAMLPGKGTLRVYGPSLDYLHQSAPLAAVKSGVIYAHHVEAVDVPAQKPLPPLSLRLRPAPALTGTTHGPEGEVVEGAILISAGRVSPVRGYAFLPLPVRDGQFRLPGCEPGRTYQGYFLDPRRRLGAVADLTLQPGAPAPRVRLSPCGTARLRCVDEQGKPRPGCEVSVRLMTAGRSDGGGGRQPVRWFDPVNYANWPVTDADGDCELPALIPGAWYAVVVSAADKRRSAEHCFRAEAGATVTLPDFVVPADEENRVP